MAYADCPGIVVTDANGVPACEDAGGNPLAWVADEPFTLDDVDPTTAGEFFAAGFVLYGSVYLIGRAVKVIIDAVRR